MNFDFGKLGKLAGIGSHIHTIIDLVNLVTDIFNTGRKYEKETSPTATYREMLDEAIGVSTLQLLRNKLKAQGADVDALYEEMARYFKHNPVYIPAWRESLAAVSSIEARVEMLEELALASESEKDMLFQIMDQRHPIGKALYERFSKTHKTWKRMLAQDLSFEDAKSVRAFLNSLSWIQRSQFTLSIGALTSTEDRESVLNEVLAAYPNMEHMREIAIVRGLIKPSSFAGSAGKVVDFAKKLATPKPSSPADIKKAKKDCDEEWDKFKATVGKNPFCALKKLFS